MDEVSRNTLERFVENVEELKKYCTPENNYGGLMGIFRMPSRKLCKEKRPSQHLWTSVMHAFWTKPLHSSPRLA